MGRRFQAEAWSGHRPARCEPRNRHRRTVGSKPRAQRPSEENSMRSRYGLAVSGAAFVCVVTLGFAASAESIPLPVPAPHSRVRAPAPPPAPAKSSAALAKPVKPVPADARRMAEMAGAAAAPAPPGAIPGGAKPPSSTAAPKSGPPTFDASQRAIVERVNGYLSGLNTLVGNFVQVGPDGGRAEGKFYLQK